jgi:hypothetical protein
MAGMLWFNGPLPDKEDSLGFCFLCSMIAKGFALQDPETAGLVNEVNAMGLSGHKSVTMTARLPGKTQPEPAVTTGINPVVQQAVAAMMGLPAGMIAPPVIVPLCWSHVYGLTLKDGGVVVPATADQMPGQRGAVDLSKLRRG